MGITELFSNRQRKLRGEVPEVFSYDTIPERLRVQIFGIIDDTIGGEEHNNERADIFYEELVKLLCREYGLLNLNGQNLNGQPSRSDARESYQLFILSAKEPENVLDATELAMRAIEGSLSIHYLRYGMSEKLWITNHPNTPINELNHRFREQGIGYEFTSGQVIRIDSKVVHQDIIKPALHLIADGRFEGANDEFLKAHEHYRLGRHKECLNECLKAFESTMKTICSVKQWTFDPDRSTASGLIDICIAKGLLDDFMQTHLGGLQSMLKSGLPTTRNRRAGHGQGESIVTVTESTARFALNTTATNILLMIESM